MRSDLEDLAAEWGGGAELHVNDDAAHIPRIGSIEVAAWYWREALTFFGL